MSTVVKNLKFFIEAIKCSLKSSLEYKVSFIIQSVFMFVNNGFFLVFWSIVFSTNGNNINGVTMDTILYLWSIPVISYGIANFIFGGSDNISKYIISGQMDSYMLQPKHPLLNVLTSTCKFTAFGDLVYGVVLGIVVTKGNILMLLALIGYGIIGSIFYISTNVIIRSLAVWIGDTDTIASRYTHTLLTNFSIYPEEIFGTTMKVLLYTVIPVAYLAYIPINLMISFNIIQFILVIISAIIYTFLMIFIFNKAMKHYESGNTISMKS